MSRRFCWLLLAIVASIADLNVGQKKISLHEHSESQLECKGNPGNTCAWTGSYEDGTSGIIAITGGAIQTKDRYTLIDKPREGDCSLIINPVQISDEGSLTCQIDATTVERFQVTVMTLPGDPHVTYNANEITFGEVKQLESLPAELKCFVDEGKPEPKINWLGEDPSKMNITKEGRRTINTLTIDELPDPPEKVAICVAEHELYENRQKIISVTVGMAYETNNVDVKFDDTTNVATCTANGIPRPVLKWRRKDDDNGAFQDIEGSHNITLTEPGIYICVAFDNSGKELKESDIFEKKNGVVHREANESSNTQQAGMIVGIVIAALVVIAIIGGLTLFTFRRRTLCFKERRPVPTNNPSNVENGGKIQTINSPDSKEKSEMKGDQNDNTKQKEIVYAQLDLPLSQGHNVNTPKPEEKTEYAQIKFQPKENQV